MHFLKVNIDVGIVCGKLEEAAPDRSIYNRLSAKKWTFFRTGHDLQRSVNYAKGAFPFPKKVKYGKQKAIRNIA